MIESATSLSISDGEWKYITPNNANAYNKLTNIELGNSPQEQLYNLKTDVGEKTNLADKYPAKVRRLKAILQKEMSKMLRK